MHLAGDLTDFFTILNFLFHDIDFSKHVTFASYQVTTLSAGSCEYLRRYLNLSIPARGDHHHVLHYGNHLKIPATQKFFLRVFSALIWEA